MSTTDFTLEGLLTQLEKTAGITKQASEEEKKEEEKKEEGKDGKPENPFAKKDDKEEKKDGGKDNKSENPFAKKDDKEGETTKEASLAGSELAKAIMAKTAHITTQNKEPQMNKQASEAGRALADALLTKLANAGDMTTMNSIPAGVVPQKTQMDQANNVAEQNATIKPLPTGDGIRNQGDVNQIFDAIVQDALGQGAAGMDQVHQQGIAGQEGIVEQSATPGQVPDENVEKTAAVIELVNSGIDFDSAVDLVKQAEYELLLEEDTQIKQAAVNELVGNGIDFDTAVELVKEAAEGEAARAYNKTVNGGAEEAAPPKATMRERAEGMYSRLNEGVRNEASHARDMGKSLFSGKSEYMKGVPGASVRHEALRQLSGNRLVRGVAGAAALGGVGAAAYRLGREKKAAVDGLIAHGVDFDTAVGLVNAKVDELYGW